MAECGKFPLPKPNWPVTSSVTRWSPAGSSADVRFFTFITPRPSARDLLPVRPIWKMFSSAKSVRGVDDMLWGVARFEIRFWLRSWMLWIFLFVVGVLIFGAIGSDEVMAGLNLSNTYRNAPFTIASFY